MIASHNSTRMMLKQVILICGIIEDMYQSAFCSCIAGTIRAPDGGGGGAYLVSILGLGMCPVSLSKILCHCVIKETTQILVNCKCIMLYLAVLQGSTYSFHN